MATCRDIIKSAYRRSGIKSAAAAINETQFDVGMELLQDMYYGFMSGGMFGRAEEVLADAAAWDAEENQQIFKTVDPCTVTLPEYVTDGGVRRKPKSRAFTIIVDPEAGSHEVWLYDGWAGQWVLTSQLGIDSRAPLGDEFGESLKNLLAVKLADDVGVPISPLLARRAGTAKMSLATRMASPRETGQGRYF